MKLGRRSILEYWSVDRRFGLRLTGRQALLLADLCTASHPLETGGILVGRYSIGLDLAIVTELPPTPEDSKSTPASFLRGNSGLPALLRSRWERVTRRRTYYLGEWHYHPGQDPQPSEVDKVQMRAIADSPRYECPRPVLLILGRCPAEEWVTSAQVLVGRGWVELRLPP